MNKLSSRWLTPILPVLALSLFAQSHADAWNKLVPNTNVYIESTFNGYYVTADNAGNNPLIASRTAAGSWETFLVVDAGNGNIALKAQANGKYVCADNAGSTALIANRAAIGQWETFTEVDAGNGYIGLRALANGKYVCADNFGTSPLIANKTAVGQWETFTVRQTNLGPLPRVYIGTMHGWNDLVNYPNQWNFVRANADGFYANFIQLLPTVGNPGQLCSQTSPLMTHKNALFESDSRYTGLGGFPDGGQYTLATEAQEMDELLNGGFRITYTSLNYGVDDQKLNQCRTYAMPSGTSRPCLTQSGPWLYGGDINLNVNDNPTIRTNIARTEGHSTDGPMDLWASNNGGMQQGSVSVTRYARSLAKADLVMVSPGDLPAAQWLSTAQSCVRYHESNGAPPDIWADYAYDTQTPTVPESNADGSAANTITGMAYWLIHHLTDPAHWARLTLPAGASARTAGFTTDLHSTVLPAAVRSSKSMTGTTPTESTTVNADVPMSSSTGTASRIFDVDLTNESKWLDLSPVLFAKVTDPSGKWHVHFRLGGKDITDAMLKEGGFMFVNHDLLLPRSKKTLQVVLTCDNVPANASTTNSVQVSLGLLASPTRRDKLNETLTINAVAVESPSRLASSAGPDR